MNDIDCQVMVDGAKKILIREEKSVLTPVAANEIRLMEKVCQLAAKTLSHAETFVKAGVTTNEINQIVHDYTLSHNARPAPLNYHGYPKSTCTSVNECICHGVPDDTVLQEGDIINVDVTSVLNGYFGDTSAMFFVGEVTEEAKSLVECAYKCMLKGIETLGPEVTMGDVGFAINKLATKKGFHVVREIGGHGIGKVFHDEPFVPSYGKKGKGAGVVPWGCLTVEPMINETDAAMIERSIPGTSIKYYDTGDRTLSAQFEHTIMITDTSYEVLTQR